MGAGADDADVGGQGAGCVRRGGRRVDGWVRRVFVYVLVRGEGERSEKEIIGSSSTHDRKKQSMVVRVDCFTLLGSFFDPTCLLVAWAGRRPPERMMNTAKAKSAGYGVEEVSVAARVKPRATDKAHRHLLTRRAELVRGSARDVVEFSVCIP